MAELTNEKGRLKKELAKCKKEMVELSLQMAKYQVTTKTLTCENNLLNKRLDKISKQDHKGKGKGSTLLFQLETELTKTKVELTASFYRNSVLKKELTLVKTKLKKELKWNT